VKLSDWLDEYRNLSTEGFERTVAEPEDDWQEPDLLAPSDRLRDTTPRWLKRSERGGYGRPTSF
jgi:hypothetical protein